MKEIKRVWFASHYSMPPEYEMRNKTEMYCKYLMQKGVECKIFCASTVHNHDVNIITDGSLYLEKNYDGIDFVHIRCSNYKGTGIRRIRNLRQFAHRFHKVAMNYELPDVIVADTNILMYGPIYQFCKKHHIAFVSEIRDIYPLAFVVYLGFSEKNPFIRYCYQLEKKMFLRSDAISYSFPGGKQYMIDKGWENEVQLEKIFYINNGVDLPSFYKNVKEFNYKDEDLDNSDIIKVVYTGSLRLVNRIELLIGAARILKERHADNIKMLIWGTGEDVERLIEMSKDLDNIAFKGFVQKQWIPSISTKADINLMHNFSTKMNRYGQNQCKLFDYLAAGNPILSTYKVEFSTIEENNCGYQIENQTSEEIANEIQKLARLPREEREKMGANAREAAKQFDFGHLTDILYDCCQYAFEHKHAK
ncbi:MAG: glycosyltransferase family 4 protein [Prevotella sp.]|nr:glycosyltransferase family 4 protein [Prevotella sp.]